MKRCFFSIFYALRNQKSRILLLTGFVLTFAALSAQEEAKIDVPIAKQSASKETHAEDKSHSAVSEESQDAAKEMAVEKVSESAITADKRPGSDSPVNGLVWFFAVFFIAGILILVFT